jgi:hypothetical protein
MSKTRCMRPLVALPVVLALVAQHSCLSVAAPFDNNALADVGSGQFNGEWYEAPLPDEPEPELPASHAQITPATPTGSAATSRCSAPWASSYVALHGRILHGDAPPRYLISIAASGLADRLVGVITQFWWAFIAGRAIQIVEADSSSPGYSAAFDSPCINWTAPAEAYPSHMWSSLIGSESSLASYSTLVKAEKKGGMDYRGLSYRNDWTWITRLASVTDLRSGPGNIHLVSVLFVNGNRGRTTILWKSKFHAAELAAIAPQRDAVSTAFNFLFTPNSATLAHMSPFLSEIQQDPQVFWVGIHIRHADDVFSKSDAFNVKNEGGGGFRARDAHRSYFDCARAIGEKLASGRRVRWLLVSDSLSLRKSAQAEFGDKVLTDTEAAALHIEKCKSMDGAECNDDLRKRAVQLAARDLLLLSYTSAHVLSKNSGFGRLGAFLSNAIDPHIAFGGEGAACKLRGRTSDPALTKSWSGM